MELFLVFLPIWLWIKLVILGTAFFTGFLLRVYRRYPGNYEPPAVDILTSAIAYLSILFFVFTEKGSFKLALTLLVPFIMLIPHFVYIIKKKDIGPPGLARLMVIMSKKGR
jgi:hypothetical protein